MNAEQNLFIQRVSILVRKFGFCADVADFIGCQFALESNYGTSKLALSYSNYCGMKYPLVRISLADRISDTNSFAAYNGLVQCVHDYMLCLNYHRPISGIKDSVPEFTYFIKRWYSPEKDYIDKIQFIYQQFKSYKNA